MKRRPLGVKVFGAWLLIAGSVICLLSMALQGIIYAPTSIFGLLMVITGIGVLQLRNLARWVALGIGAVDVPLELAQLIKVVLDHPRDRLPPSWFLLAVHGLMICYFLRPGVKAQFVSKGS